jgi:hypothetical protein
MDTDLRFFYVEGRLCREGRNANHAIRVSGHNVKDRGWRAIRIQRGYNQIIHTHHVRCDVEII